MPTRPAVHQPHFAKTPEQRAAIERQRMRERDRDRPSAAQRGYDDDWRALRLRFIAEHPICCVAHCGAPTVDVDHIDSIREHPARRLDATNLRPFCHRHHAQRTAREQGFARSADQRNTHPRPSGRAALHPDWLRPSRVPLIIVCGPRGAGKSRFVEQRAGAADLVLDIDEEMATLSGLPLYAADPSWFGQALRNRNAALGRLSLKYSAFKCAWLVLGEPDARWRDWWRERMQPLSVFVLAVPAALCHARIDADPRRVDVRPRHHEHVDNWWLRYEPCRGDAVSQH